MWGENSPRRNLEKTTRASIKSLEEKTAMTDNQDSVEAGVGKDMTPSTLKGEMTARSALQHSEAA